MTLFHCEALLTSDGWLEPAFVETDMAGRIVSVSSSPPTNPTARAQQVSAWVIPGFQNAHSHAFQYAMVGQSEYRSAQAPNDSFWTWRDTMYGLAQKLNPDDVEEIATRLYRHMMSLGITGVVEFHYLHHGPRGEPYANVAEMALRIIAAADRAGIDLALVPVLYQQGGIRIPPTEIQQRFCCQKLDQYFEICASARAEIGDGRVGYAFHSLRAVTSDVLRELIANVGDDDVVHTHIAEQPREVEEIVAHYGQRPVAWACDNLPVDRRFNWVHATHLDQDERRRLAESQSRVVICPSTEANLGDGIFPLEEYAAEGGHFCIGTDSHISLNPLEDLRWLDYAQRLKGLCRNPLATNSCPDSGLRLLTEAFLSGRAAMGYRASTFFEVGQSFDAALIDPAHPAFSYCPPERRISALIYGGDARAIQGIIRRGREYLA